MAWRPAALTASDPSVFLPSANAPTCRRSAEGAALLRHAAISLYNVYFRGDCAAARLQDAHQLLWGRSSAVLEDASSSWKAGRTLGIPHICSWFFFHSPGILLG